MPFCRATSLLSPVDGVTPGFWLQLSWDAPTVWTGQAQTAWPAIVVGIDTVLTYAVKVQNVYTTLCTRFSGSPSITTVVCRVNFTFTSLSPLTIGDITVVEADCKLF